MEISHTTPDFGRLRIDLPFSMNRVAVLANNMAAGTQVAKRILDSPSHPEGEPVDIYLNKFLHKRDVFAQVAGAGMPLLIRNPKPAYEKKGGHGLPKTRRRRM